MFYGLHFTSDAGQVCQVRVNTANGHVHLRATHNGDWSAWRRVDVERNADGTLAEEVQDATNAKRADVAGRLSGSVTLTFEGDVSGIVRFDGSQGNISTTLKVPALADILSRLERLERA